MILININYGEWDASFVKACERLRRAGGVASRHNSCWVDAESWEVFSRESFAANRRFSCLDGKSDNVSAWITSRTTPASEKRLSCFRVPATELLSSACFWSQQRWYQDEPRLLLESREKAILGSLNTQKHPQQVFLGKHTARHKSFYIPANIVPSRNPSKSPLSAVTSTLKSVWDE